MQPELTMEKKHEICRVIEAMTLRRRRWYAGHKVYGITQKSVFQRDYNGQDLVLHWSEIRRIRVKKSRLDRFPRLTLCDCHEKKMEMASDHSCEFSMFLNELAGVAAKHDIDCTEPDRLREDRKPWRLDAGTRSPLHELEEILKELKPLILPILPVLGCMPFIAMYSRTLQSPDFAGNPYRIFLYFLAVLLVVYIVGYALLSFIVAQIEQRWDAYKKRRFEKLAAQIEGQDWKAYHAKQREDREKQHERLAEEFRIIAEHRKIFHVKPRKVANRLAFILSDELFGVTLFILVICFACMIPLLLFQSAGNCPDPPVPIQACIAALGALLILSVFGFLLNEIFVRLRILEKGDILVGHRFRRRLTSQSPFFHVKCRIGGRWTVRQALGISKDSGMNMVLLSIKRLDKTAVSAIPVSKLPNGLVYDEITRTFYTPKFRLPWITAFFGIVIMIEMIVFCVMFYIF